MRRSSRAKKGLERPFVEQSNRLSQMLMKQFEALAPRADLIRVRRCHSCGETHESLGGRAEKCRRCQKTFAPFFFVPETPGVDQIATLYRPLVGMTACWDERGVEDLSAERLESRLYS